MKRVAQVFLIRPCRSHNWSGSNRDALLRERPMFDAITAHVSAARRPGAALLALLLLAACSTSVPTADVTFEPLDARSTTTLEPTTRISVKSLTLLDADTGKPVFGYDPIPEDAVLDLSALPANISVRANTKPSRVGSVRFRLDGRLLRTENYPPYAVAGDAGGRRYYPWRLPGVGEHTLEVTPYTAPRRAGSAGTPLSRSFTLVENPENSGPSKKLIAFSSDAGNYFRLLTPGELKTQLAGSAAAPPVDGVTLDVSVGPQLFSKEPYPDSDFAQDRADLAGINYGNLSDNFLRVQSSPSDETWSWLSDSDWAATERNVRNVARTAAVGGFAGILFDPEPYDTNPWAYSGARYPNRSFAEVEAVVRERGGSFMQAIQAELPNAKVLSLFLMAIVRAQTEDGELETTQYALLRAFLEGWLDVAEDSVTLIDGNEGSYYYTATEQFENGAAYIRGADSLISPENRSAYNAQVEVAQAVYVDGLLNLWNAPEFFGFYLKDDEERRKLLEHHTYHGLKTSDAYVWVYSENVRWWQGDVPDGLRGALERAQSKVSADAPLGFGVAFVDEAVAAFDQRQSIEGTLLDRAGDPIAGAYLKSGPPVGPNRDVDAACRFSDGDGYYTCTFPSGWSGTLTPSREGYTFSPPSRSFENVTVYAPDQDFTGLASDEVGGGLGRFKGDVGELREVLRTQRGTQTIP